MKTLKLVQSKVRQRTPAANRAIRLLLDTSTKIFSLAVARGDEILVSRRLKSYKTLSKIIIPAIDKTLKKVNLKLDDVAGFAVGLGPGSFTGLRVGLSTVKGFVFALNKPVCGVSSLDLIALNIKGNSEKICVISDARRNLVYACIYSKKGNKLSRRSKYLLIGIKDLLNELSGEVVFIGDAVAVYKTEIMKHENKGFLPVFADEKLSLPKADNLVYALTAKNTRNRGLNPLYLYKKDCQVRNDSK